MKKVVLIIICAFAFVCSVNAEVNFEYEVKSENHALELMNYIYSDKASVGEYYLKVTEESGISTEALAAKIDSIYTTPYEKNMYKYKEYGEIVPYKFYTYLLDDNTIVVNNYNRKITESEKEKVNKFVDIFVDKYKDKTDYEKIYLTYTYLNKTLKYPMDFGFENFVDAYISSYDALFDKTADCVGTSTTFQLFMEKFGIESYIVERVAESNPAKKIYATSHSFNVVKIDDNWYIVDASEFYNKFSQFLTGVSGSYLNDHFSEGMTISETDYNGPKVDIDIDYNYFNRILDKIDNNQDVSYIVESETSVEWIILALIVIIVMLVILLFTKRK